MYNSFSPQYNNQSNLGYEFGSNFDNQYNQNQNQNNNYINHNIGTENILFQNVAIISKKAKKVLDVCQDTKTKGILIIYQDCKMPNQRFNIIKTGQSVKIVNRQNGNYLTVGTNSQSNGVPIIQSPILGSAGQNFRLEQTGDNQYIIYTFCGKVLDCCREKTENGTRVIQYPCDRKDHQKWIIKQ